MLSIFARKAAGASSARQSLRPSWGSTAPSDGSGREFSSKASGVTRREIARSRAVGLRRALRGEVGAASNYDARRVQGASPRVISFGFAGTPLARSQDARTLPRAGRGDELALRLQNQLLHPPVQQLRGVDGVFRRTGQRVDPAELLQLLAGLPEHAEHLAVEAELVDAAGPGIEL